MHPTSLSAWYYKVSRNRQYRILWIVSCFPIYKILALVPSSVIIMSPYRFRCKYWNDSLECLNVYCTINTFKYFNVKHNHTQWTTKDTLVFIWFFTKKLAKTFRFGPREWSQWAFSLDASCFCNIQVLLIFYLSLQCSVCHTCLCLGITLLVKTFIVICTCFTFICSHLKFTLSMKHLLIVFLGKKKKALFLLKKLKNLVHSNKPRSGLTACMALFLFLSLWWNFYDVLWL